MRRPRKYFSGWGALHDPAEIHHGHGIRQLADNGKIVRYEQERYAQPVAQVAEQIEDLRLDPHVQRRQRFVGDDQLGFNDQCTGQCNPLPLPPGQGMWITITVFGSQANRLQHGHGSTLPAGCLAYAKVIQWFCQCLQNGPPGAQGCQRVLEYNLYVFSCFFHSRFVLVGQVFAVEQNASGFRCTRPEDGLRQRRFTGAGFAHQGKNIPGFDLQADIPDSGEFRAALLSGPVTDHEIADTQQAGVLPLHRTAAPGHAASSSRVYGCWGRLNSSVTPASSTICP